MVPLVKMRIELSFYLFKKIIIVEMMTRHSTAIDYVIPFSSLFCTVLGTTRTTHNINSRDNYCAYFYLVELRM